MTLVAVLLVLGTCSLVTAGACGAMHLQSRRRLRRLRAATRVTCADLVAGRLPSRALVIGTTVPGPNGMLRSSAFDQACVWFSTELIDTSDGIEKWACHSAAGPVGVRDATGTVLFDPRLALQDLPASALLRIIRVRDELSPGHRGSSDSPLDRLERTGRISRSVRRALRGRTITVEEKVIEAGRPVTVLARPRRRRGLVLLGRWGAISVEEPPDWAEELEEDVTGTRSLVRFCLIVGVALCVAGALPLVFVPGLR